MLAGEGQADGLAQRFQASFVKSVKSVCSELNILLIPIIIYSPMLCSALYRSVPIGITRRRLMEECRYWMSKEQGGFIDKWYSETEKLLAQGVDKYEAFEKVSLFPALARQWR